MTGRGVPEGDSDGNKECKQKVEVEREVVVVRVRAKYEKVYKECISI